VTTVHEIITRAYRESNLVVIGLSPTLEEQEEGLVLYNQLQKELLGFEFGDRLGAINLSSLADGVVAPVLNCEILLDTNNLTLIIPDSADNGSRIRVRDVTWRLATFPLSVTTPNSRIEGGAFLVLDQAGSSTDLWYSTYLNQWLRVKDALLPDVFPFDKEDEAFFELSLAVSLSGRSGLPVAPETGARYKKALSRFRSKYNKPKKVDSEQGLLRLSRINNAYHPLSY
jgi:hypothetical protein